MDKKLHLANTNERSKKIYKLKSISAKQAKFKKKEENNTYAVHPQKSSSEKAKQSESYSVYQKGHKKSIVKSDEVRSYRSDEDDSAEKDKYRKQMQFTSFQQKAAEMNSKLSTDIQVNIETAKKQASVSSYQSGNTSNSQYSDKTKEAAAMLASRLAGDILRKTQINDDSQAKSSNSSMGNSKPDKSQRVCFYLKSNEVEKARLMKPDSATRERFNKAADNTYKEREKIKAEIAKENNKIKRYQKESKRIEKQASKPHTTTFEKVEDVLYLEGKVSGAVNKGSTGEAAAAISVAAAEIAAKKVIEEAAKNHKSIGEISRTSGAVGELSSSIDRENSVGSAAASAFTAVPKYYIAQKAADTVKKSSQKHYKDKLDKKLSALRAKQKAAEKRIEELKKEQAKRQVKINIYKAENGITSKSNSDSQNIKAIIKSQHKAAKAAAAAKSSATIVAAAGGVLFPILGIVVIIIIIAALFSWIMPHEENFYVEADNAWETVMLETSDEILKGYIKHIQDYFDQKQLEILEVVDLNFGGFQPDKYDYNRTDDENGNMKYHDFRWLSPEYTEYYISRTITYKKIVDWIPGSKNSSAVPIYGEESITNDSGIHSVLRTEYYKIDDETGYEVRCKSTDYDYTHTYILMALDIESYWNLKYDSIDESSRPVFTCENGFFDRYQDITNENMVLRKNGQIIYDGSVLSYIMDNPSLFEHIVEMPDGDIVKDVSIYTTKTYDDLITDWQYKFDNYIFNLNEYKNRWIKLSDDCDYEHIIAMAAIKKWQEIVSDRFDLSDYDFAITDDDLDYVIDDLYDFYYSYSVGQCKNQDCHRYYVGQKECFECDRSRTHKHLIGQVTNIELAGGIDLALNKILKIPKRSDYNSDDEYNDAMLQFETAKDIYNVYVEYIYDQIGSKTNISDYENDKKSQYRLLLMYQAKNGKKPSNPPTNVKCSYRKELVSNSYTSWDYKIKYISGPIPEYPGGIWHTWEEKNEHIFLDVSWDPPKQEEYAKGKTVEITGYYVYSYDRSRSVKRLIAATSDTMCSIDFKAVDQTDRYSPEIEYETVEYDNNGETVIVEQTKSRTYKFRHPEYTEIIVEAYNGGGSGPGSDPIYISIK